MDWPVVACLLLLAFAFLLAGCLAPAGRLPPFSPAPDLNHAWAILSPAYPANSSALSIQPVNASPFEIDAETAPSGGSDEPAVVEPLPDQPADDSGAGG